MNKKKIVFATNNEHKLREIQELIPEYQIISLKEINCLVDIPETANSLEGNAIIKANYVTENYNCDCFSDDTGLEVDALNNAPGVYSARYAGPNCTADDNVNKLLKSLDQTKNRSAQFRTAIALNINGKQHIFEGICKGEITSERSGSSGFGYDPIFRPTGSKKTFAEMTSNEKGSISHRGLAVKKLVSFLKTV